MTTGQRVTLCVTLALLALLSLLFGLEEYSKPGYLLMGVVFAGAASFVMLGGKRNRGTPSLAPPGVDLPRKPDHLRGRKSLRERFNFLWPRVDTLETASAATRPAFWVAVLSTVVTVVLMGLGMAGVHLPAALQRDGWSILDVAIYALIAAGLWRHSRPAAYAGLIAYLANLVWITVEFGKLPHPFWTALYTLVYIHGIRGTRALHQLRAQGSLEQERLAA
jgi:hypothetical protein